MNHSVMWELYHLLSLEIVLHNRLSYSPCLHLLVLVMLGLIPLDSYRSNTDVLQFRRWLRHHNGLRRFGDECINLGCHKPCFQQ